jgi:hypothetical protein
MKNTTTTAAHITELNMVQAPVARGFYGFWYFWA